MKVEWLGGPYDGSFTNMPEDDHLDIYEPAGDKMVPYRVPVGTVKGKVRLLWNERQELPGSSTTTP